MLYGIIVQNTKKEKKKKKLEAAQIVTGTPIWFQLISCIQKLDWNLSSQEEENTS